MMPGAPGSAPAAKDRRRLTAAPGVVGEDLVAGLSPLDLVELVSVVQVHFEAVPSVRFFAASLSRRADASQMDTSERFGSGV
jgi:hypothetical protein